MRLTQAKIWRGEVMLTRPDSDSGAVRRSGHLGHLGHPGAEILPAISAGAPRSHVRSREIGAEWSVHAHRIQ